MFSAVLLPVQQADAEWSPGYYMAQSLDTCFNAADRFLGETEYGYAPLISLVGTFMAEGERYPMVKNFAPNGNYVIIAAGDEDATDVDVRVLGPNGQVIAEDRDVSEIAIIDFNAGRGGQFRIEVDLYQADEPSFVSFVILQEGGWYIPRREFDIAKEEMFGMCERMHAAAEKDGLFLQFNDGNGQATLFGGLLGGEEGTMLTNLNFGEGTAVIAAAGDSDVEDIDLVLYDDNNRELNADRLPDAQPIIFHNTTQRRLYNVEILSEARREAIPTYCIVGLLQLR